MTPYRMVRWATRVAEAMEVCESTILGTFLNSADREIMGSTEPIDGAGESCPALKKILEDCRPFLTCDADVFNEVARVGSLGHSSAYHSDTQYEALGCEEVVNLRDAKCGMSERPRVDEKMWGAITGRRRWVGRVANARDVTHKELGAKSRRDAV